MRPAAPVFAGFLGLVAVCATASGAVAADAWTVDPVQSKLGFSATQSGAPFSGSFKTWSATIDYDSAKPAAAHIHAVVKVASAGSGDIQRDEAMPGSDWFDAADFADATFDATGFTPKGGTEFETSGTLTLRGVSKKVTLPFTLTVTGNQAHAVGKTTLVRTDFGVGQGSWSDGSMVGLDVTVDFDLVANKP